MKETKKQRREAFVDATVEHRSWLDARNAYDKAREQCQALHPAAERWDNWHAKLALVEAEIAVENAAFHVRLAELAAWRSDDAREIAAGDALALAADPRTFLAGLDDLRARREDAPLRAVPIVDAEIEAHCAAFAKACSDLLARRRAEGRAVPQRPTRGPAANASVFAAVVRKWLADGPPAPQPSSRLPLLRREADDLRVAIQREHEAAEAARTAAEKHENVPIGATYATHHGHGAEDRAERARLRDAYASRVGG